MQMLFEERHGGPVARLPHMPDGTPRVADGVRVFTLAQAASRWGWSEAELREQFEDTFAPVAAIVAPIADDPAVAAAATAAGRGLVDAVREDLLRLLHRHLDDVQYQTFLEICRERGVSPWLRQIIPEVHRDADGVPQLVLITTIEYLRIVAERSGQYNGQLAPQWCGDDGAWKDIWTGDGPPTAARVGVLRHGHDGPTWGVVKWDELARPDDEAWQRMPTLMLAKCAEAAAIRRAFPDAARLYLRDEIQPLAAGRAQAIDQDGPRVEPDYDQLPAEEAAARHRIHRRRPANVTVS